MVLRVTEAELAAMGIKPEMMIPLDGDGNPVPATPEPAPVEPAAVVAPVTRVRPRRVASFAPPPVDTAPIMRPTAAAPRLRSHALRTAVNATPEVAPAPVSRRRIQRPTVNAMWWMSLVLLVFSVISILFPATPGILLLAFFLLTFLKYKG